MSNKNRRTLPPIIEHLMDLKKTKGVQQNTLDSFWTDANAALESLLAEFDKSAIVKAMKNQGFAGEKYLPNVGTIIKEAKRRREDRKEGPLAKRQNVSVR